MKTKRTNRQGLTQASARIAKAIGLPEIMAIVRTSARDMTGADGVTFVLREVDQVYYADESAIRPLWKGQRFPISDCISGWSILNRCPVTVPILENDPRIPLDLYRTTFVKSLAIVPIGMEVPIGTIGAYWAIRHQATEGEVAILEGLAQSTFTAIVRLRDLASSD